VGTAQVIPGCTSRAPHGIREGKCADTRQAAELKPPFCPSPAGHKPAVDEHGSDHSTAGLSAERIGRNDAIFRQANERISEVAEAAHFDEQVPFICECADPACREIVPMMLDEYADVRREPRLFLNVPGHQASAQGWGQVVESHNHYVVVEKVGPAGEVAEQLDGEPDPATAPIDVDPRFRRRATAEIERPAPAAEREERVGRNEALFRTVNERIENLNDGFGAVAGTEFGIVCECGSLECAETISTSTTDYRRVRADPTLFILVAGHDDPTVEAVVEEHPAGYVVVRKHPGKPADIAAETAPD
jgi:hypothetical protein